MSGVGLIVEGEGDAIGGGGVVEELLVEAADLLGALGADQYWTLFGAYFPPHVRVPVVQLTLQGGHRIFLSPTVSPAFSDAFASTYSLRDLSDPDLVARWRPNFGTGRIEKLEARAGGLAPSGLAVRTGYTAARVRRWANAAPDLAARVRFVDLLSVGIRSAHDGRPPTVFSVDPASIEAGGVDDWPVARTRQLFDVRR